MKTIPFNLNDYIHIQITEKGWEHLINTVGKDYVKHCIEPYKQEEHSKDWYRLQAHQVFNLLPINNTNILYKSNIKFEIKE